MTVILVCAFILPTAQAQTMTKDQSIKELEKRAMAIQTDIDSLRLLQNRLIFMRFLENRKSISGTISIFGLKTFNPNALFDTVPHIRALRQEFLEADKAHSDLLNKDRKYRALRKEYDKADTKDERNAASEKLHAYRLKKYKERPDWEQALDKRTEAVSRQGVAVTRFVLDYYQEQKMLLPYNNLIPPSILHDIEYHSDLGISNIFTELTSLEAMLRRTRNEISELKY